MKGLVFGKFLPFHTGHEALIRFARAHAGHLTVLVCASDKETIALETRMGWLRTTFAGEPGISVEGMAYDESKLPNTSESSRDVSRIWAAAFQERYPDLDLLVSSEPYGDYLAEFMGIEHLCFDQGRELVPVSATAIRSAPVAHWGYLPEAVRPFFQQKVVLLGTESTGKTTLCRRLAAHFEGACVEEAARQVVEHTQRVTWQHLESILQAHAEAIRKGLEQGKALTFIDTDHHITRSYARFLMGRDLPVSPKIARLNQADLYLYLGPDAPLMQDGTRLDEDARMALDESHRNLLAELEVGYHFVSGSWEERFVAARELVRRQFSLD